MTNGKTTPVEESQEFYRMVEDLIPKWIDEPHWDLLEKMLYRMEGLEDRLNAIDAGEPRTPTNTESSSASICEPIESGNPDICPTCGHRLRPLTPGIAVGTAEKQRNYRNRQKGKT